MGRSGDRVCCVGRWRKDKSLNGQDLISETFYVAAPSVIEQVTTVARPRIGVDYAGDWAEKPLRFYVKDNSFVSKR